MAQEPGMGIKPAAHTPTALPEPRPLPPDACPSCSGTGAVDSAPCPHCGGAGKAAPLVREGTRTD